VVSEGHDLEESFLLDGCELETFFDCRIAFEEGSGGDASAHPLDGHHDATACHKRRLVPLADVVSLQADSLQQFEDLGRRLVGNLSFAHHVVGTDAIPGRDPILGDDHHSTGIVWDAVNSLRLTFSQQFTSGRMIVHDPVRFVALNEVQTTNLAASAFHGQQQRTDDVVF
jgi:hypothetical protein